MRARSLASITLCILVAAVLLLTIPGLISPNPVPTKVKAVTFGSTEGEYSYGNIISYCNDGSFYFRTTEYVNGTPKTTLTRFSPSLEEMWSIQYPLITFESVIQDGSIAVMTIDTPNIPDTPRCIRVFNPDGQQRWSKVLPPMEMYPNLILLENGTLYTSSPEVRDSIKVITAYDPSGNEFFVETPAFFHDPFYPWMLANGTIAATDNSTIYGFSSDLVLLWTLVLPHFDGDISSIVLRTDSIVVIKNDFYYTESLVQLNAGGVFCYGLDGSIVWRYPQEDKPAGYYSLWSLKTSGPILVRVQDYSNSSLTSGKIVELSPDGTALWEREVKDPFNCNAEIYGSGALIWNGYELESIEGDGAVDWTMNMTTELLPYIPVIQSNEHGRIYFITNTTISLIEMRSPQISLDVAPYLIIPVLIAVVVLAAFIMGKKLKDDDD